MFTPFLTVEDVRRTLNISTTTLYRLIDSGELPVVRIRRGLRIHPEELQRYIARHTSFAERSQSLDPVA